MGPKTFQVEEVKVDKVILARGKKKIRAKNNIKMFKERPQGAEDEIKKLPAQKTIQIQAYQGNMIETQESQKEQVLEICWKRNEWSKSDEGRDM